MRSLHTFRLVYRRWFEKSTSAVHATVLWISRDFLEAELMMYCDKIRSRSTRTQISQRTVDEGSRCVWLMDWQRTAEQKREMCSTFASTDGLAGDLQTHHFHSYNDAYIPYDLNMRCGAMSLSPSTACWGTSVKSSQVVIPLASLMYSQVVQTCTHYIFWTINPWRVYT